METSTLFWISAASIAVGVIFVLLFFRWVFSLRRVVAPNAVHILRQGKNTLIYGNTNTIKTADDAPTEQSEGNSYYQWPIWVPGLGVNVSILPLSIFDIDISGYDAYDKDRLPFVVDIKAFFRIYNYKTAAERVSTFEELKEQLLDICRGAARTMLAKEDLEAIMSERSKYGADFTREVKEQLACWGVEPVKNIELMDIRDAKGEEVIANIMRKKKSAIEKDSRVTVAKNNQEAKEAEIAAKQEVDLKQQAADETVGKRQADVEKEIGISQEKSNQAIQEQKKTTAEKEMEVKKVSTVKQAEIDKEQLVINTKAAKEKTELDAEAKLIASIKAAEGIKAEGEAKAEAEKKMQLASVEAQITLANEIGTNEGYQQYLIKVKEVEATMTVGLEQAKNIKGANIKIIANAGNVAGGLTKALDVLTPNGGVNIAGALEALGATEAGQQLLAKFGIKAENTAAKE